MAEIVVVFVVCNSRVAVVVIHVLCPNNCAVVDNDRVSLVDNQTMRMKSRAMVYTVPVSNHSMMMVEVGEVAVVGDNHCLANSSVLGNAVVGHYKLRFLSKLDDRLVLHYHIDPNRSLAADIPTMRSDCVNRNDYTRTHLVADDHNSQTVDGIYPEEKKDS